MFLLFLHLQSLFRGLALNKSLTWLDLSSNFLSGTMSDMDLEYDDAVMGMVADGIGENTTLKYLNLSDNR
jgi:hypothetical protein